MGNELPETTVRSLRDYVYEKHTNQLTLRSIHFRVVLKLDLPSLRNIYSTGDFNFHYVGIVNIESRVFHCL